MDPCSLNSEVNGVENVEGKGGDGGNCTSLTHSRDFDFSFFRSGDWILTVLPYLRRDPDKSLPTSGTDRDRE